MELSALIDILESGGVVVLTGIILYCGIKYIIPIAEHLNQDRNIISSIKEHIQTIYLKLDAINKEVSALLSISEIMVKNNEKLIERLLEMLEKKKDD